MTNKEDLNFTSNLHKDTYCISMKGDNDDIKDVHVYMLDLGTFPSS